METRVVAKTILVSPMGQVLLLRRSASDTRRPLQWDIPGGHTDGDEVAEEAAIRETQEEAGVEITHSQLRLVYSTCSFFPPNLNVVWLFFVVNLDKEVEVSIGEEHTEFRWAYPDEAINLIEYDRQKTMFEYLIQNHLLIFGTND